MKKHFLFSPTLSLLLLAAGTVTVSAATEDTISKSFQTAPKGTLFMKVDRGSIDVKIAEGPEVKIQAFRKIDRLGAADAADVLKNHQLDFSQVGNDVRVIAEFKNPGILRDNNRNRLNVRYLVSVPRQFNVELKTSGGDIRVGDLEGRADLKTAGGNLHFGHIKGSVLGRTAGGNVSVGSCSESAEVETSGGNLDLGNVAGHVNAKTAGGNITVTRAGGDLLARTAGGNIKLKDAAGKVEASTSGGSVTATLSKQPKENCSLKTSAGSIDIMLAEKIGLDLDAKTSAGHVVLDYPTSNQSPRKKSELQAKLNGGGPTLTLRTSGGNVNVRKM